jgi:hypothetical protein
MRSSLSGEEARALAAQPCPAAALQIAIEATANIIRAGPEIVAKPDFLSANVAMILARVVSGAEAQL